MEYKYNVVALENTEEVRDLEVVFRSDLTFESLRA